MQQQRGGDGPPPPSGEPGGPATGRRATRRSRAQARAEMTEGILAVGRRQLADQGAAGLSLRAVARELGVVSSAVYRYVATRDDLLTLLITAAYNDLGDAVEASQAAAGPVDPAERFAAACRAIRTWALDHPHEYALIFGSPVPGYHAPGTTTAAAARIPSVFAAIVRSTDSSGDPDEVAPVPEPALAKALATALAPAMAFVGAGLAPERVLDAVLVWAAVFGSVSFEVFGRYDDSIDPAPEVRAAFFEASIRRWADILRLAPPTP